MAITFDPPLSSPVAAALAAVTYGHAAKLFIPLGPGSVDAPPSATLAVGDRYWAWTATGDGSRVQPVISAFAGSPDALRGLGVAGARSAGSRSWSGFGTISISSRSAPCSRPGTTIPGSVPPTRWRPPRMPMACLRRCHGRIGFAGEHLGGEMSALMEGAIRSGRRTAARVAESL